MAEVEEDLDYKVVMGGGGGVGKSSLTVRLIADMLLDQYLIQLGPVVEDQYRKVVVIDGKVDTLEILDASGREQFLDMQKDGKGFLLVYSITSKKSFNEVSATYDELLLTRGVDSVPCVLVGNQCDLENKRQVTKEEGEKLASQWGCPFYETSARERINNEVCFYDVVREIRRHEKIEEKDASCCMIL